MSWPARARLVPAERVAAPEAVTTLLAERLRAAWLVRLRVPPTVSSEIAVLVVPPVPVLVRPEMSRVRPALRLALPLVLLRPIRDRSRSA